MSIGGIRDPVKVTSDYPRICKSTQAHDYIARRGCMFNFAHF
jgi:hypothetical protein